MTILRRALLATVWLWGAAAFAQTAGSALESTTGPSVGISAGGYTGGALGSSNFFQSTPPTPGAGAAATPTSPGTSGNAASPAASSPVPSFSTGSTAATSTSAATGRASTVAPAGVSAVGESLSGAGTAVVPSTLSTPTTSPAPSTTGSAAPASTQPYPNLLE